MLAYLWLPYMILPIHAGLERLPDPPARGLRRPRRRHLTHLPLRRAPRSSCRRSLAGSVFTFSLSLGDYITVQIVGGKTQLLGNVSLQVTLDLPLAAALSAVPVALVVCYLLAVRRTGALDSL